MNPRTVIASVLTASLLIAISRASLAQVPITPNSAPPPLQNVQSFTIDSGPGSQFDPHVDGNLISYTYNASDGTGTRLRYFRIGVDATPQEIARGQNEQDFLSHVSDGRIAYSHVNNTGTHVMLLDTAQPVGASNPLEINPSTDANRFRPAIGGNTIAYIDLNLGVNGELVAYDLATNTSSRLTSDTETDQNPSVSPDGNTIVWEHCPVDTNHCDIWKAVKSGGTWTVSVVSNDPSMEDFARTNGSVVVYASDRPAGSADIFFRDGGGIEYDIQLPGIEAAPGIAGDLVIFAGNPTGKYDIYLYEISTNRL